ncbi:MAG: DNA-directed RNA polymerase subunit omega [Candidatus Omnitrophota bacterium]
MAYVALEELLDKSCGSVYKLVILASKRALEIAEGQPKLVQTNSATKPSTVALLEISAGRVQCKLAKSINTL